MDKKLIIILLTIIVISGIGMIVGLNNAAMIADVAKVQSEADERSSVKILDVLAGNAGGFYNGAIKKLQSSYPGIEVMMGNIDVSTGGNISMAALMASGSPPDLYEDFISRSGKYMVSDYALDFAKYLDLSDFVPAIINQMKRGESVYGLPKSTRLVGMFVNVDLVGTPSDNWTIDEFLTICEKLKAQGQMPYVFFAANQSSCEWLLGWFPAFGAEFFQDGDFTTTTIKSSGGVKAFEFVNKLHDLGYIPEESAVLTDDDAQPGYINTTFAMSGTYIGNHDITIQSQIDQGVLDKKYNYKFYGFPSGIKGLTPVVATFHAIVARASDNEYKNQAMAFLADAMTDTQNVEVSQGGYASRKSVTTERTDDIHWQRGTELAKNNGVLNIGMSLAAYGEIRGSLYPVMQKMLSGQITPEEAITEYEGRINSALADAM